VEVIRVFMTVSWISSESFKVSGGFVRRVWPLPAVWQQCSMPRRES
jgi:hypothetical protein